MNNLNDFFNQLAEQEKACNKFIKEMTKEMIANSEKWKAFKEENKEYFQKVKYPQTAISDLAPKYA